MGYLAEKALGLRVRDDKRPPLGIRLSFGTHVMSNSHELKIEYLLVLT